MKTLNSKTEITAKNLKSVNCDFKGYNLGYNKTQKVYFIGSHFNSNKDFFATIRDLKLSFN